MILLFHRHLICAALLSGFQAATFAGATTMPPVVENLSASNVTIHAAVVTANVLSTGGITPKVTIFYGTSNGKTTASRWASSVNLGLESGVAAAHIGSLRSNATYYFTARASNSKGVAWAVPSLLFTTPASNLMSMLTYHNDNARDGVNSNETQLTPANVNTNSFGLLFSRAVDGYVYAQPLVATNVLIPGKGLHNVVYVATEHDSVYAFDADSNAGSNAAPLWQASFINPAAGVTTASSADIGTVNISSEAGITATPVIDPATGTLYVEALTKENTSAGTVFVHRLHALDMTTGAERAGGVVSNSPAIIAATNYPGNGDGDNDGNGHVLWNPLRQNCRSALTLLNGAVYIAFASYADVNPYHGWLFSYSAESLAQLGVYNTTPNGLRGGIWQGGGGATVDEAGNFYYATGNGNVTNDFNAIGDTFSQATNNFAMSVLKFTPSNGVPILVDYFSPFNQGALSAVDSDLGSGAALVLPDSAGSPAHPHLLVAGGKTGTTYLLDRDNLGHFNPADNSQIVQVVSNELGAGSFVTPAFYNKTLYYTAVYSPLVAFTVVKGANSTPPAARSATVYGLFGCGSPSISADGISNGIVWTIESDAYATSGPTILHAYDAANVARELYNSSMVLARDNPGGAVKYTVPTVVNGKVYVGAEYALSVFGLGAFLPLPVIKPNGGLFTNTVTVRLSDSVPGCSFYYTLDGSAPSTNSLLYRGRIVLTNSAMLQVIASKKGTFTSQAAASFIDTSLPGHGLGLLGAYYSGQFATFTPPPTTVRTDAVVNFHWENAAPAPGASRTNYTVQWTGCVQPRYTEAYTFTPWTEAGGARLWINGQLLVDDWSNPSPYAHRVSIPMKAQQFYNIEMDYYYHDKGQPVAQLFWSSHLTPQQIIPKLQLYTVSNPPPSVAIISPTNGESLNAAASFNLSADVTAAFNQIEQVSFYADGQWIGTVTNLPYSLTNAGLPEGLHALTATAVDTTGLSATSAPVQITVGALPALLLTKELSAPGKSQMILRLLRGVPGWNYVLEASTNLTQWNSVSTNPTLGAPVPVADLQSNAAPYQFYRVRPANAPRHGQGNPH